jgi:3-phenylpropionate/trans-cinnamate dioxygenase ferredoxin reductase subunit
MSSQHAMKRIVIAGGSTAGIAAARTLRQEGFDGELAVVEPEVHPPYDRTTLSKELMLGRVEMTEIALLQEGALKDLDLRWHRGRRAAQLRADAREVMLDDGLALPYDGLVLATGSSPRRLPGSKVPDGVHYLRGLDDASAIRQALSTARRFVLVGGGFVGLELAAAAVAMGVDVTVVEADSAPLVRTLGAEVGAAIARRHAELGVEIFVDSRAVEWVGERMLTEVGLNDGRRVAADLAVVGIGAIPNIAWLADSPVVELGRDGVICDATLATALPGVVAAGDIVRWPHPLAGRPVRIEHFEHAELSGAHAARRLLYGEAAGPYEAVPFVWSHQGDHVVHAAGFPSSELRVDVVDGDLTAGPFAVTYHDGDRLVAVVTLDSPRLFRRLRRQLSWEGVAV